MTSKSRKHLFFIRNLTCIFMFEEISRKMNLESENIILLINSQSIPGDDSDSWAQKLIDNIKFKYSFHYDYNFRDYENLKFPKKTRGVSSFITKRLNYREAIRKYREYLVSNLPEDITDLYLPQYDSVLDESVLIDFFTFKSINIHRYEEGINSELYESRNFSQYIKNLIIKLMNILFLNSEFRNLSLIRIYLNFKFNNYFTYFPNLPHTKNYDKIIALDLPVIDSKLVSDNFSTLFMSRPLYEKGVLSLDEELNVISKITDLFHEEKIYVKFHPGESKNKIEYILNNTRLLKLPDVYDSMPMEEILVKFPIKNLVGYDSITMMLFSHDNYVNVYSVIELANKDNSVFKTKLLKEHFKNIKFI